MSPNDSEGYEGPARWRPRHVAALLLAALFWVAPLFTIPLLDPDEGRYGEIPREMLVTGDLLTPRLNGTLYFEKPPLHYWLTAGALRWLGDTEVAVRLWSALFGLGTAAVLLALGGAIAGPRTARLATALLLASPFFFSLAHVATLDMTLTFFVTLALAGFWKAQGAAAEDRAGRRLGWAALFGGAALAVMSKGLVGMVLPGGVIFCYLLLSGRWRLLRAVPWVGGTALFLALAAPWHVLVARQNPAFATFYFLHEHFLRYATPAADRGAPVWYFFAVLAAGLLPWGGLLVAVPRLRGGLRFAAWRRERPELLFLLCWIGFVVLFFSASHSKLAPYVLPATPPLALLAAMALAAKERGGGEWTVAERLGLVAGAAASLAAGLAATLLASGRLALGERALGESPVFRPLAFAAGLAAAGGAAVLLARVVRRRPAALGGASVLAGVFLTAALWALVAVAAPARSGRAIAEVLAPRLEPGDRVVCVAGFRPSLAFYLGRLIGSAAPHQDLAFGVSQLPEEARRERFPTGDELKAWWDSERRLYVVVDPRRDRLGEKGLTGGTVLFSGKRLQLVVNHPPADG